MARVRPVPMSKINGFITKIFAEELINQSLNNLNYSNEFTVVILLKSLFKNDQSNIIQSLHNRFTFKDILYQCDNNLYKSSIDLFTYNQTDIALLISSFEFIDANPFLETGILINDAIKLKRNTEGYYKSIFWVSSVAGLNVLKNVILRGSRVKETSFREVQANLGNHFENFVVNNFDDTLFEITLAESIKVHDIEDIYLSRLVVK
jgi:hypothetical protein